MSAHRQNKSKDIFAFALPVRSQTWLHNKDPVAAPDTMRPPLAPQQGRPIVWLPDLCRHVGRSGGERIPDAAKPRRRARFASREELIKFIEPHSDEDRAGVIPICRPMPGFLAGFRVAVSDDNEQGEPGEEKCQGAGFHDEDIPTEECRRGAEEQGVCPPLPSSSSTRDQATPPPSPSLHPPQPPQSSTPPFHDEDIPTEECRRGAEEDSASAAAVAAHLRRPGRYSATRTRPSLAASVAIGAARGRQDSGPSHGPSAGGRIAGSPADPAR